MLRSRRFLIGLAMTLLFIGIFLYRVDLQEMGQALRRANYLFVIPGVSCYFLALVWRTLRWQAILQPLSHFSFRRLWPVITVGYAANNVLPVRLGELVRAYYLSLREGASKSSALGTILLERTFDGLALLFLVGVVSLFVPVVELFRDLGEQAHINWLVLTLGLSVPFFLLTTTMITAGVWPAGMQGLVRHLVGRLPAGVRGGVQDFAFLFLAGLSALHSPRRLLAIFLLSVPVWLSEAGLYFFIALGFEIDVEFSSLGILVGVLILTTATSNLGTSIPSTGGGIGPFEFFAQATLIFFGVGAAVASAYTLVVHAALLIPVTILGLVYVWVGDLSLIDLARSSQSRDAEPGPVAASSVGGDGSS